MTRSPLTASARTVLLASLLSAGCSLYDLPEAGPARELVLNAAREAVEERYPMSATSERGGYVLALTTPGLDGVARTRKQISIYLHQNYTGHYEPVVKVRHYVDVSTPRIDADPAATPALASPFASPRWRVLGDLPLEEHALTHDILTRLDAMGL